MNEIAIRIGMEAYQQAAHTTSLNTSVNGDTVVYPALGLANEAGEVLGKLKKVYRDYSGHVTPEMKAALTKELGDVVWYVAEIATALGIDLGDVAMGNLHKLFGRLEAGTIQGEGDNR